MMASPWLKFFSIDLFFTVAIGLMCYYGGVEIASTLISVVPNSAVPGNELKDGLEMIQQKLTKQGLDLFIVWFAVTGILLLILAAKTCIMMIADRQ